MLKEIINSFEVDSFNEAKAYLKEYIPFYSDITVEECDKNFIIEKVFDYLETFKLINKVKDDEIYKEFSNTLHSFINVKQSKETKRINNYLDRFKEIKSTISKTKTIDINDVKDFARVFLCLYFMQIKKNKDYKDEDFSFDLNSIDFKSVIKELEKHKKATQLYSKQKCSIVLLIIVYFSILNVNAQGE